MSRQPSQLDELAAAVDAEPENVSVRKAFVEALLDEHEIDDAIDHFEVLGGLAPNEPWLCEIDERIGIAIGDAVRTARARRRHRELMAAELAEDAELARDGDAMSHPSKESLLRLVGGGAQGVTQAKTHLLDQVAGLATVKAHLSQIVRRLRASNSAGTGWQGGALFYGPPGCGKRYCASVIAGELDARFLMIDFSHSRSAPQLRESVSSAIDASTKRTVVYLRNLDERRGNDHATAIDAILDLLDQTPELIVLGSATSAWNIDPKLVGHDRFNRVILMLPPDPPARYLFFTRRLAERAKTVAAEDLEWLAHRTEGHSFADIDQLLHIAAEGSNGLLELSRLSRGLHETPPSSAQWLTTAAHHAMLNESSGIYDDLLAYFEARQHD